MKLILSWIVIVLLVLACVGYVITAIKLTECDFEKPYKAKVIHTIGLFPAFGAVTGWLDVGK